MINTFIMSLLSFTGSVDIRDVQCFFPSSYLDFKGKIVFQKHLITNLEKLRLTPRLNNPKDSMVPSQCLKIFSFNNATVPILATSGSQINCASKSRILFHNSAPVKHHRRSFLPIQIPFTAPSSGSSKILPIHLLLNSHTSARKEVCSPTSPLSIPDRYQKEHQLL